MVLLYVLDVFEILEIKGNSIKTFIHYGSVLTTPVILLYNLFVYKSSSWNSKIGITSIILVLSFSIVLSQRGFLGYLFSISSWNTQMILYEHKHYSFKQVEFQMQDVGALGYNKRYVKVTYITKWLMITEIIDPKQHFGAEWIEVNEDANELNIVY